jgi:hypothetical protein
MNLNKLYLTKNNCYISAQTMVPKGIMVHSTGANNPTLKRYIGPDDGKIGVNTAGNHWNTAKPGGAEVCVHAFIGKLANGEIATYQTLPWNYRGWHAGLSKADASKYGTSSANNTHISFEICEDGLTDPAYFAKVYKEAVELTAYLCNQYNLNPLGNGVILCHSEGYKKHVASNHADVMHWFPKHGKSMDTFREDVDKVMKGGSTMYKYCIVANRPTTNEPIDYDAARILGDNIKYPVMFNNETAKDVLDSAQKIIAIGFSTPVTASDGTVIPEAKVERIVGTNRWDTLKKVADAGNTAKYR